MKTIRGGAILCKGDKVALMEYERDGHAYFVFPGGRMEKRDGTIENTMVREVWEETGLLVEPTQLLAIYESDKAIHHYYAVKIRGGKFGTGKGPEFHTWEVRCGKAYYEAVWVPVSELKKKDVRPKKLARAMPDLLAGNTPVPLILIDKTDAGPASVTQRALPS